MQLESPGSCTSYIYIYIYIYELFPTGAHYIAFLTMIESGIYSCNQGSKKHNKFTSTGNYPKKLKCKQEETH